MKEVNKFYGTLGALVIIVGFFILVALDVKDVEPETHMMRVEVVDQNTVNTFYLGRNKEKVYVQRGILIPKE